MVPMIKEIDLVLILFSFFIFFSLPFASQQFDSAHRSPKAIIIIPFCGEQSRKNKAKSAILTADKPRLRRTPANKLRGQASRKPRFASNLSRREKSTFSPASSKDCAEASGRSSLIV